MREVILNYHPKYLTNTEVRNHAWNNPNHYNPEHLVEEVMAHVGGYKFLDEDGYDFSDYSDSKTASIGENGVATVGGILGKGKNGGAKLGDLRVILYNPFKDRLDYYFMPKAGWESIREYGDANKGRLRAAYSPELDRVYKWHQWQVKDFETLATTPSTVSNPRAWTPIASPKNTLFFEVA